MDYCDKYTSYFDSSDKKDKIFTVSTSLSPKSVQFCKSRMVCVNTLKDTNLLPNIFVIMVFSAAETTISGMAKAVKTIPNSDTLR